MVRRRSSKQGYRNSKAEEDCTRRYRGGGYMILSSMSEFNCVLRGLLYYYRSSTGSIRWDYGKLLLHQTRERPRAKWGNIIGVNGNFQTRGRKTPDLLAESCEEAGMELIQLFFSFSPLYSPLRTSHPWLSPSHRFIGGHSAASQDYMLKLCPNPVWK